MKTPLPLTLPERQNAALYRARACQQLFYAGTQGWSREPTTENQYGHGVPGMDFMRIIPLQNGPMIMAMHDVLMGMKVESLRITTIDDPKTGLPDHLEIRVAIPEYIEHIMPYLEPKGPGELTVENLIGQPDKPVMRALLYQKDVGELYLREQLFNEGQRGWEDHGSHYSRYICLKRAKESTGMPLETPKVSLARVLRDLGLEGRCSYVTDGKEVGLGLDSPNLSVGKSEYGLLVRLAKAEYERKVEPLLGERDAGEFSSNVAVPDFRGR